MARILVIDDDRAVLSTIKLLLERDTHAVETVDNSRAGLQLLETAKVRLADRRYLHARDGWFRDHEACASILAGNADHRDIGAKVSVGIRRGAGFPVHGHQTRGGFQPAKAIQAARSQGSRYRKPVKFAATVRTRPYNNNEERPPGLTLTYRLAMPIRRLP